MSTPPFGWKHEDGELVEDDIEQEVIKMIRVHREKKPPRSFGNIAAQLNREGTLNRGKFWSPTTIWYILQREDARETTA